MSDIIEYLPSNKDVFNKVIEKGYSVNQANIISTILKNPEEIETIIESSLKHLPDLTNMSEIDKGSEILHKHIENGNHIALVTDSDMDGISSAFVLYRMLIGLFKVDEDKVTVIINKRSNGNGITEKLLATVLDVHERNPIDLVITGDHGSSNGISIGKMKDVGMEVIVTDHHLVPEKDNAHNSDAFINPQKDDNSVYKYISGCAVAYFLMIHTYNKYDIYVDDLDISHELLPVVAASTIGDSMKLFDPINRALVNAGLKEMNSLKNHIWQAFKYLSDTNKLIDEEILSFNFIPAINASNRMGEPVLGFNFYKSNDYREAVVNFNTLLEINDKRKKLQQLLIKDAKLQIIDPEDKYALTIVLERGFGLNGIVSGNIGEQFFKPVMSFVKHDGELHGSGRSINNNFNLHQALGNIHNRDNSILIGFGGHKEACGCKIHIDKINDFKRLFNDEARRQLEDTVVTKTHYVVGELDHEHLNEAIFEDIRTIAPFGIGFNKIKYVGTFTIDKIFYVGRDKEHLSLKLSLDTGETLDCFIFNSLSKFDHDILAVGKRVKIVYIPTLNTFKGAIEFRLSIEYITEVDK